MPAFNDRSRRSIRLRGFDYSADGAYFLTICVRNRECLLGEIQNKQMILNNYGKIVREIWESLPNQVSDIDLDEYVIMPNHFHAILVIDKSVDSSKVYSNLDVNEAKSRRKMILPKVVGRFKMLTANTNLMGRCTYLDPPKSPLRRGTLRRILSPPPTRGVRGDRNSMQPHKKLVLGINC